MEDLGISFYSEYADAVRELQDALSKAVSMDVTIESVEKVDDYLLVVIEPSWNARIKLFYRESGEGEMDNIVVSTESPFHALFLSMHFRGAGPSLYMDSNKYHVVFRSPSYELLRAIIDYEKMMTYN